MSSSVLPPPAGQQAMAASTPVVIASDQTAVPVSGTFFQATQPISAASLPLPAGAATSALQTTSNTSLGNIDTKTLAAGQAAMVASSPVVIASNQSAVPVSGTFWQATQPVSAASLPLPAGAATETTVAAVSGKLPATLGQKAMVASMAVVVASDQSAVPVSGTFFQSTQPVSAASLPLPTGASTEATLSAMSAKLPASLGGKTEAASLSVAPASFLHMGRFNTFRIPGRAGTTGQKILAIHNATGSAVTLRLDKVWVDLACTVVKAITVLPPVVRLWKVTVLPTNGTAATKVKTGGTGASSASVTVFGDASADGTNSGTALTATLPAGTIITQEFAPRFITGAGYEMADRIEFLGDFSVDCGPLEGVVLFLDYTAITQNPITDMWVAGAAWREF